MEASEGTEFTTKKRSKRRTYEGEVLTVGHLRSTVAVPGRQHFIFVRLRSLRSFVVNSVVSVPSVACYD